MREVELTYQLVDAAVPRAVGDPAPAGVQHPLFTLLDAVHRNGSISDAARQLRLSYRHVWGELKRWETTLGRPLILWAKGQPAALAPFGEVLLWSERRAQARMAPQIEALRQELAEVFAPAPTDADPGLHLMATHDTSLTRLHEIARGQPLRLRTTFGGSLQALQALNDGACDLAGFHVGDTAPRACPSALVFRQHLQPREHRLILIARRMQGLMVARGNPLGVATLKDLRRADLRWVGPPRGSGAQMQMLDLLAAKGQAAPPPGRFALVEPTDEAAAMAVASGAADVAFGPASAARTAELDFVPLAGERCFLVTRKSLLNQPAMLSLLGLLGSPAWALADLPGSDLSEAGKLFSLTRALPWWNYRSPRP